MALVGGGGTPNVAGGSNPSGTGTGLNYIGNHCYAHSGKIETVGQSTETTMLKFTTANSYIDSRIALQQGEDTTDDIYFAIKFNGEIILAHQASRVDLTVMVGNTLRIIIPSYTDVEITVQNFSSSTARDTYAIVQGDVYA